MPTLCLSDLTGAQQRLLSPALLGLYHLLSLGSQIHRQKTPWGFTPTGWQALSSPPGMLLFGADKRRRPRALSRNG